MKLFKKFLYSLVFIFTFSSYVLGFNFCGFDVKTHICKTTGTKYNEDGFDIFGYDKDGYDYMGFSKDGIHKITKNNISPKGRDVYGISEDYKDYYPLLLWSISDEKFCLPPKFPTSLDYSDIESPFFYTKYAFCKSKCFDKKGFNTRGINKDTGTIYDKEGFTVLGFDKNGKHKSTGTEYSKGGMDFFGRNKYGQPVTYYAIYKDWFTGPEARKLTSDLYLDMKDVTDSRGFDVEGWNHDTDSLFDKEGFSVLGFDKNGNHKETGSRYSPLGFDFFGRDVDGNYIANYFGPHRDFDFFGDKKPNFCLCCSGAGMRDVYKILKKYDPNKF